METAGLVVYIELPEDVLGIDRRPDRIMAEHVRDRHKKMAEACLKGVDAITKVLPKNNATMEIKNSIGAICFKGPEKEIATMRQTLMNAGFIKSNGLGVPLEEEEPDSEGEDV
jgi:hypothetical protein